MKDLEYHIGLARECIKNDKERMALYAEVDLHRLGKWQPSAAMRALPWIADKNFSSTAPADAIDAGARTFATLMPKINIAPVRDNSAEYEDAEQKETALDWHFKRMNMWGGKTTHWRIMESAMRYCAVSFETEYLPFLFKGRKKDKRLKALLHGSAFRWTPHHPGMVHSFQSKYGLESVVLAKSVSFQDLLSEYGAENDGVKELKEKMFSKTGNQNMQDRMRVMFTLYKSTDWDETCIWVMPNSGSQKVNTDPAKGTKILHMEHGLDFIPWVIADNEDPLLKNAIATGLLDNLNNLRLLSYSAAVSMVAASQQLIQTPDGTLRNIHIDTNNPTQPMVTDLTAQVRDLQQPRPNDAVENKVQQATSEVYSSTVAQILADANKLSGGENFSSTNLAYKVALGSLSLAKDAAERAESMGFYQMFQWIDHAGDIPLIAYRDKGKMVQDNQKYAGEEIVIRKGEFDTDFLYIDVKMREFSSLDEQAKANLAITMVERLGLSKQIVAEKDLGIEDYSVHEQKRAVEDLMQAKIQVEIQSMMAMAKQQQQMQMQQAQTAMQQEQMAAQQPPPEAAQQVQDMNQSMPVMQGADMRGGMMPAQPANPMETQQTIQGNAGGVGLA